MSYPLSRRQTVTVTPIAYSAQAQERAEAKGEDLARFENPPRYVVAVPSVMERAAFRRDLTATGARFHDEAAMLRALRKQVRDAFDEGDPEADRLVGLIDAYEEAPGGEVPEDLRNEVARLEEVIRSASPEYAAMAAARAHWLEVAPILACRHFLKSRENPGHVFRRQGGMVTDAELAMIPEGEMFEVGFRILQIMQPTTEQEKNSASPSPSRDGQETSPAASTPPTEADGNSSAGITNETPASC